MRLKWTKEKQSWCVNNWMKMIFRDDAGTFSDAIQMNIKMTTGRKRVTFLSLTEYWVACHLKN